MDVAPEHVESRLRSVLVARDVEGLRGLTAGLRPVEIARALDGLEPREKIWIFESLDPERAGEMLDEADPASQVQILEHENPERIVRALDELPSDKVTDLLEHLPVEEAESLLNRLNAESSGEVRELLEHKRDTAGGLMSKDFVALPEMLTAREAIARLQRDEEEEYAAHYLYVVNASGALVGVLPLHRLVFARPDAPIRELMIRDPVSVKAEDDQEEVIRKVRDYDLVAVPVLHGDGLMVGVVTVDDVLEAAREENTEDLFRMAGTAERNPASESPLRRAGLRLPWILVTLFGGVGVALVIGAFEGSVEMVVFTAFLPMVPAVAGNVGIQASTILVRSLALSGSDTLPLVRPLLRELSVSLFLGLFCGFSAVAAVFFLRGDASVGWIVGGAILGAMLTAGAIGTLVPIACSKVGIDPALAAGPFVIVVNDLLAVTIYLLLAAGLYHTAG